MKNIFLTKIAASIGWFVQYPASLQTIQDLPPKYQPQKKYTSQPVFLASLQIIQSKWIKCKLNIPSNT